MRCCGKSGGRNKKTAAPRPFFIFNSSSLSEKRALLPAREYRPQTPPACGQALSAGTSCPGRGVGDAPRQLPPTRPPGREVYSKDRQRCGKASCAEGPPRAQKGAHQKAHKITTDTAFRPKGCVFPLAGGRSSGRRQRIKLVRMPPSCCGKAAPACAPALMQRSSQAMFRARLRMVCSPS